MVPIENVSALEVLDSRGNPTLSVTVRTGLGSGTAVVPSGASTGAHEAVELRDEDPGRYGGKGVQQAIANVEGEISDAIEGMDVTGQGAVAEVYHSLKKVLAGRKLSSAGGDEGGCAPEVESNEEALELIVEAIEAARYEPGEDIAIALDPAASEFYRDGVYNLAGEGRTLASDDLVELYEDWLDRYPIVSIEDGMAEDDWEGWR